MAVIYRITNMANGKYYIGSAEILARREWQHRYELRRNNHKNPRLQAAWNKYGEEMFVFEVLEDVPKGTSTFDVENTYLHVHVGQPDCYNVNTDAIGMRTGIKLSQESKDKVSRNRTGKHAGSEHYRYGQTVSTEVRAKIGAAQRGKPKKEGRKVSEAGKAKIKSNIEAGRSHKHWTGRTHTEESKAKMSRPVVAITDSGSEIHAASITQLREMTGLKPPTINRALKSGQPLMRGKFAGWSFKYVDPSPST